MPMETKKILHVVPVGDSMEHATEGGPCACAPRSEAAGDGVVIVHDALDGRGAGEHETDDFNDRGKYVGDRG